MRGRPDAAMRLTEAHLRGAGLGASYGEPWHGYGGQAPLVIAVNYSKCDQSHTALCRPVSEQFRLP